MTIAAARQDDAPGRGFKARHPSTYWSGLNKPRTWQREALPLALDALLDGRWGVIRAIMGAGKSIMQAELLASLELDEGVVVMVTVPTLKLVHQLTKTLDDRLGLFACAKWCTDHSRGLRAVNVVCHASMGTFAQAASAAGVRVIWVADEAHKTEAPMVLDPLAQLDVIARLAFTATPWRADAKQSITSFKEIVYDYGPDQALADRVVVELEVINLVGAGIERDLDELCVEWAAAESEGGIVNAVDIADAEGFVELLRAAGVTCAAVHSGVSSAAAASALERHKAGGLRVLVHVNMLAEGVDMPWLRWLIARRDVKSSVRFPQEVGRILRAYPGKTMATVYDPHDLFGRLGLTLAHALGDAPLREAAAAEEEEPAEEREPEDKGPKIVTGLDDVQLLVSSMRRHYSAKYGTRFAVRKKTEFDRATKQEVPHWSTRPSSDAQMGLLRDLLKRQGAGIPERFKPVARGIYAGGAELTSGQASDLIDGLMAMSKGRPWII